LAAVITPTNPTEYVLDPTASEVIIDVGKTGLLAFLGHTHEVAAPVAEGTVRFDRENPARSTLRVVFEAGALRVTGRGEPAADVPEVQRTMESAEVLNVARFPRIVFASREIRVIEHEAPRLRLRISGDLALHGITRTKTADVLVNVEPDRLIATGTLVVKQTDFGIEPVRAGAGTVRVRDDVRVRFSLVAMPLEAVRRGLRVTPPF
jgi:polyisoprenoid-binding protein YceI